jgi:hypothetical protein
VKIRKYGTLLEEEGGVYNALGVASNTTRPTVCGPANVAKEVPETLSKSNNILVHAIATFFSPCGNSLPAGSLFIEVGPTVLKVANDVIG